MRLLLLLALAACSKPEPTTTTTSSGSSGVAPKPTKTGTPIPKDHPKTFLVTKHCHLSPHPPSRYFSSDMTTYDLQAATWTRTSIQGNEPDNAKPDEAPPTPTKTGGAIDSVRLAAIRTSLDKVLANGPYEPKYPPSGGGRCTLNLHAKDTPPFFTLDRADDEIKDEVGQLLSVL